MFAMEFEVTLRKVKGPHQAQTDVASRQQVTDLLPQLLGLDVNLIAALRISLGGLGEGRQRRTVQIDVVEDVHFPHAQRHKRGRGDKGGRDKALVDSHLR